jgi:hypothetical protein
VLLSRNVEIRWSSKNTVSLMPKIICAIGLPIICSRLRASPTREFVPTGRSFALITRKAGPVSSCRKSSATAFRLTGSVPSPHFPRMRTSFGGTHDAIRTRVGINNLAPHDLCRTCARLCHLAGGELEQIQFLLGHASVETTERYLGCKQKLSEAVNDKLGLEDL